ncbi:extracellular solute-binding protein [Arthrobacter sp. GMC3]|uniref:extracellular solute-binding protein n=1 Tax=Arthrobacter sp. GMC3 TaxID=2058894 RepID=UPI000CE42467|nr:extracellular solute-binding protein [Arthrobacter sp. GMC3]
MTQHSGSSFGAPTSSIPRRKMLKFSLFGAVGLVLSPAALTACSNGSKTALAGGQEAVALPAFAAPVKPTPTLPGTSDGVMDVYASFPMNGPVTVKDVVGDGSEFEFLVMTYGQPAPPLEENAYWQILNKELNLKLKPVMVPYADFPQKFPAMVAGNDLPDVVSVPVNMTVNRLPELAKTQFTDLSDFISGDAVKKYPNLAGIPPYAWKNGLLNGRMYGVPKTDPVFGGQMYTKPDVFEKAGANLTPKSLEEFEESMKAVTDPKAGVYALGNPITDFILQSYGVQNKWTQASDGTFTSHFESEQFIPAIEKMATYYKAGYFHPDTATLEKTRRDSLFRTSKLAMTYDGNRAFGIIADDRNLVFSMMPSFGFDGTATPTYWTGKGAYAITMLKKTTDEKKIDQFLKTMNWLCAPFGSKESFIASYGQEGTNYEMRDGVAILTERGQREQDLGFAYIAGGPQVLVNPQGAPGVDAAIHAWQTSVIPYLAEDPTAHLYSPTQNSKGASLEQGMTDAITAVFLGRSSSASLKSAVSTWKSNGGEKIATEFAEAVKA